MSDRIKDMSEPESLIQKVLRENVQPYVNSHGGELMYSSFADGVVYVSLRGACERCSAINVTLRFGIERILRKACAEVDRVELVRDGSTSC